MATAQESAGVPERIGRYHVVGKIAQGGMADVLLAKLVGPQGFERPVVIKRILPTLRADNTYVSMFLDEAKLVAGIRHPNVVQVMELSEDGDYFLVMEYLAGETISNVMRRLVRKNKRLPYAVCAYIIAEAAAGLHAAHELRDEHGQLRGVVHRDISPQNVFVTYDGVVKVIDFGIAKATDRMTKTEAGQLKGKFAYMAPESCRGGQIDRRTDLFALATVLYEMTTRMRLFVRDTDMKTLEAVCYDPIRPPSEVVRDYPKELEAVVMKGLARDPSERYPSAAEMRRDLVRVAHSLSEGALPEEQLRAGMRSLFGDRVAEKDEMLRKVKAGVSLRAVPTGDVDEEVSMPLLVDQHTGQITAASTMTGLSRLHEGGGGPAWNLEARAGAFQELARVPKLEVPPPAPEGVMGWIAAQERWKLGMVAGAVGMVALVVLVAVLGRALSRPGADEGDDASPTGSNGPTPPAVDRLTASPPAGVVTLEIDSTPSGASITTDGVYRGVTPMKLEYPRSESPVALELSMPGYRTITEPLVPNVTQRLGFALEPTAPTTSRKRK